MIDYANFLEGDNNKKKERLYYYKQAADKGDLISMFIWIMLPLIM